MGFDHRMYCKVLNEGEVEKQTRTCERYYREGEGSSSGSSDDDNDNDNDDDNDDVSPEEESDYSEYETESSSSSMADSLDQGSEPSKRGRSPKSNKLFDDILGNNRN